MEHEYAGFWIRVLAAFIDTILILLITMPILLTIYDNYWDSEPMIQGAWDFIISYIFPAIATVMFWIYKSATPGKMVVNIAVIDAETGEKLSTGQAVLRYIGYYLASIPLLLGIIWVAFDKKKQGWHDKIAKTLVVYKS